MSNDLDREIRELKQAMAEMKEEMIQTQTIIRDYNNLRKDIQWSIQEIKKMKDRREGQDATWNSVVDWIPRIVTLFAILYAAARAGGL